MWSCILLTSFLSNIITSKHTSTAQIRSETSDSTPERLKQVPIDTPPEKLDQYSLCIPYNKALLCSPSISPTTPLLSLWEPSNLLALDGVFNACLINGRVALNCDVSVVCPDPFDQPQTRPGWTVTIDTSNVFIELNPSKLPRSILPEGFRGFFNFEDSICSTDATRLSVGPYEMDLTAIVREYAPGRCAMNVEFKDLVLPRDPETQVIRLHGPKSVLGVVIVATRSSEGGVEVDKRVCIGTYFPEGEGKLNVDAELFGTFRTTLETVNDVPVRKGMAVLMDSGGITTWVSKRVFDDGKCPICPYGKPRFRAEYWADVCVDGFCDPSGARLKFSGNWEFKIREIGVSDEALKISSDTALHGLIGLAPGSEAFKGINSIGFVYSPYPLKGEIDVNKPKFAERCYSKVLTLPTIDQQGLQWLVNMSVTLVTNRSSHVLMKNANVMVDTGWTVVSIPQASEDIFREFFNIHALPNELHTCPSPDARLVFTSIEGHRISVPLSLLFPRLGGFCHSFVKFEDKMHLANFNFVFGAVLISKLYVVFNKNPSTVNLCIPRGFQSGIAFYFYSEEVAREESSPRSVSVGEDEEEEFVVPQANHKREVEKSGSSEKTRKVLIVAGVVGLFVAVGVYKIWGNSQSNQSRRTRLVAVQIEDETW